MSARDEHPRRSPVEKAGSRRARDVFGREHAPDRRSSRRSGRTSDTETERVEVEDDQFKSTGHDVDAAEHDRDDAKTAAVPPPTILQQAYETAARPETLFGAIYRTYEHSGFTMAGSVAFSFLLALFPFCIFVGALAGVFGGRELAEITVKQLFEVLPSQVAETLAPQIDAVIGRTRVDLITIGGAVALFFATNGIETLRNALNYAYREQETRPYPLCVLISATYVIANALGSLVITWLTVVAPTLAREFEPEWLKIIHQSGWWDPFVRYGIAGLVIAGLLTTAHKFLAAGKRDLDEIMPGVVVSVVLWLVAAGLYSYYLSFADYTRFYAGLSQIMVALIFFQVTAVIIIVGAEFNRGLMQLKRYGYITDKD
ncbi:MAG: YihY/virulence factor BrkB family protein [Pseudomonadota bacterium]